MQLTKIDTDDGTLNLLIRGLEPRECRCPTEHARRAGGYCGPGKLLMAVSDEHEAHLRSGEPTARESRVAIILEICNAKNKKLPSLN